MTLQLTEVKFNTRNGVPLEGYPSIFEEQASVLASLARVRPENVVSWIQFGLTDLQNSNPLKHRDSADLRRIWQAQTTGTTRETDPGELSGCSYYSFNGTDAGFYGTLEEPLTDYTIAMVVKTPSVVGIKGLFNVGTTAGTRLYLYVTADDIAVQHGTGDVHTFPGSNIVANVWTPIVVSFKASNNNIRGYTTTSTPILSATTTNDPPSDLAAAFGSLRSGAGAYDGDIAFLAVWNTPIHEDATALENLVAGLNSLVAL